MAAERVVGEALKVESLVPAALGGLAGLVGAGFLTASKWLVEWGRPRVKLVTGAVDAGLGGYLLYRQLTKKEKPEPFLDTATATFALLELLVGASALVSALG
jgi:hypothetical protein